MAANPRAIPLADLRELRLPLLRTAVVRVGLALLLLALLAGAWAIVRDDDPAAGASLIPGGEGGVIVMDLSASIGSTPHLRTANALRYVQQSRQSFGMVLFSDVAYEAVPPGTASTEMASFMRHFGTRAPVPMHPPRLAAVPGRHLPGAGGHSLGRVQPARRGGHPWRQPGEPVVGQLPLGHPDLARARDRLRGPAPRRQVRPRRPADQRPGRLAVRRPAADADADPFRARERAAQDRRPAALAGGSRAVPARCWATTPSSRGPSSSASVTRSPASSASGGGPGFPSALGGDRRADPAARLRSTSTCAAGSPGAAWSARRRPREDAPPASARGSWPGWWRSQLAAALAVFASDVLAARSTMERDDLRFRVAPDARGPVEDRGADAVAGVGARSSRTTSPWRVAAQRFQLSRARANIAYDPTRTSSRAETQAGLASGGDARRSPAGRRRRWRTSRPSSRIEEAVGDPQNGPVLLRSEHGAEFRRAIRLDRGNEEAKFNLELLLQLLESDDQQRRDRAGVGHRRVRRGRRVRRRPGHRLLSDGRHVPDPTCRPRRRCSWSFPSR